VFVDGKDDQRPECLRTALKMLSENGVVILHDSERENYREAITLFKVIENTNETVVLKK
jgi:predicted O-methyltransferase YrrM